MANTTQSLDEFTTSKPARVTRPRGAVLSGNTSYLVMYAILIVGVILAMLPFFWMLSASLMTYGETATRKWYPGQPHFITPQFVNYVVAWNEARFSKYFFNSVVITAVTLTGQLLTSILAGYAFARIRFWGRDFIFAVLLSTMMIPAMVVMIPNFMIVQGRIFPLPTAAEQGTLLATIFGVGGSWLNSLIGITLPFMVSVFSIFLLRQFFAQIPWELWDAARMDGAGHTRFLFQVVLPISKAPIFTVLIFAFIGAWNDFLWPLLVTTRDTWRPLMVGLWTFATEAGPETQLMMAGAVITIVPILILYFLTQKQYTEGIATSGLKG